MQRLGKGVSKRSNTTSIKKSEYEDLATCIRSDQVPAGLIAEYFEDKPFYKWYKKKYL